MKKAFILLSVLTISLMLSAQTQQGYVKTKGRMVNGKLVPGQGLKGATVSIKGRTAILVKADDGAFSFPITEAQFRVDSVRKKGYRLVDMDAIGKTYKHSPNPLYLVMETPEQQLQDQLDAERKIRRTLTNQLHQKEDEIERLKEQQKISDEEYRQALQKLYQDQENNEQLIKDMAKRYSEWDYDQLDEFYRQVSYCIENGELVKADSLLRNRGDITAQVGDILQRGQIIQQEKEQIQKAEAVQQAEIEEAAQRCYCYYETFAAQHLNDTAAYYLELRASLDTTNVEWQNEVGMFCEDLGDYKKALMYHLVALRQAYSLYGEQSDWVAISYNNIGAVYKATGDYNQALEYYRKALNILKSIFGDNHPNVAICYNNIGNFYSDKGENDMALEYFNSALAIQKSFFGDNHPDVAKSYSNIGNVYSDKGDYDMALEYFNKALSIIKLTRGENHPDMATIFNSFGILYVNKGDYQKSREEFFNIRHQYSNSSQVHYRKALDYYNKAVFILTSVFGENHPKVAITYNNIGDVYCRQGCYDTAVEYYSKCLIIRKNKFGESHPAVATCYNDIGDVLYITGNYDMAIEFYDLALKIQTKTFGLEDQKR